MPDSSRPARLVALAERARLVRDTSSRLENLQVICPECGKPSRIGRKRLEDGTGVRFCKACNATMGA